MAILLKLGSKGSEVASITAALAARGYLERPFDEFDRQVKAAVMAFQSQHLDERGLPLKVDGVVGPVTRWALDNPRRNAAFDADETTDLSRLPAGGSARGRAALRVAVDEVSAGASEQQGNNRGPFVAKYLNGLIKPPADWCAGFVSWCFDQHPDGCPFGYTLGARDILKRCRQRGWVYDHRTIDPKPGDIVVWRRGPLEGWQGHVGLVFEATAGGVLHTIEGNKGAYPSRVRSFSYVRHGMDTLLGYARVGGVDE